MTLTLVTYDWLPDVPRGFVRDLRVRWALEELGRAYRVDTVPSHRSPSWITGTCVKGCTSRCASLLGSAA